MLTNTLLQGLLLLGLTSSATAWLPKEKLFPKLAARSGNHRHGARHIDYERNSRATLLPRDEDDHNITARWLPASGKIRGVNLGGLFIVEPWMMPDEWNTMGCSAYGSEFDCVSGLGQQAANAAFQKHWASWITQDDINQIASLGLNTIRIPVGYWMKEDLVYSDSEHFPQGGYDALVQVAGWASDAGLYIIIDHHGAPGAQVANNAFTGQLAPTPGFYQDYQFERGYEFLEWMTNNIHTNNAFRNVGALEIVNEPVHISDNANDASYLINTFYPTAWQRIRAAESKLGITDNNKLHIQMMNAKWGTGDPNAALTDLTFAAYDDHRYVKYDSSVATNRAAYLAASCADDRSGNTPTIVGEWSLSVADAAQDSSDFSLNDADAAQWYQKWWAAQVLAYEKVDGWIYWTWKVNKIGGQNDWRWGYQQAVAAGAIPQDAGSAASINPC